ncbi:hypothetical protein HN51_011634 [Arachis hypogaea]
MMIVLTKSTPYAVREFISPHYSPSTLPLPSSELIVAASTAMRRCLDWLYFIEDSMNETSSLSTNGKLHLVGKLVLALVFRNSFGGILGETGWEDVSNTWETLESLEHVRDYVNEFDVRGVEREGRQEGREGRETRRN